jgi:hypothetical protein
MPRPRGLLDELAEFLNIERLDAARPKQCGEFVRMWLFGLPEVKQAANEVADLQTLQKELIELLLPIAEPPAKWSSRAKKKQPRTVWLTVWRN